MLAGSRQPDCPAPRPHSSANAGAPVDTPLLSCSTSTARLTDLISTARGPRLGFHASANKDLKRWRWHFERLCLQLQWRVRSSRSMMLRKSRTPSRREPSQFVVEIRRRHCRAPTATGIGGSKPALPELVFGRARMVICRNRLPQRPTGPRSPLQRNRNRRAEFCQALTMSARRASRLRTLRRKNEAAGPRAVPDERKVSTKSIQLWSRPRAAGTREACFLRLRAPAATILGRPMGRGPRLPGRSPKPHAKMREARSLPETELNPVRERTVWGSRCPVCARLIGDSAELQINSLRSLRSKEADISLRPRRDRSRRPYPRSYRQWRRAGRVRCGYSRWSHRLSRARRTPRCHNRNR